MDEAPELRRALGKAGGAGVCAYANEVSRRLALCPDKKSEQLLRNRAAQSAYHLLPPSAMLNFLSFTRDEVNLQSLEQAVGKEADLLRVLSVIYEPPGNLQP